MALGNLTVDTNIVPHGSPVWNSKRTPAGYEQITGITSAKTLTVPANARMALIQPTGQSVRWRDDGTAPTATVGMVIAANAVLEFIGNLDQFRVIQTAATAVVNVSYYY